MGIHVWVFLKSKNNLLSWLTEWEMQKSLGDKNQFPWKEEKISCWIFSPSPLCTNLYPQQQKLKILLWETKTSSYQNSWDHSRSMNHWYQQALHMYTNEDVPQLKNFQEVSLFSFWLKSSLWSWRQAYYPKPELSLLLPSFKLLMKFSRSIVILKVYFKII